jgi:hypothetical protein
MASAIHKYLEVDCPFCKALAGNKCVLVRGKNAGQPADNTHVVRSYAYARNRNVLTVKEIRKMEKKGKKMGKAKSVFKTNIELGKKYRDKQTGYEGTAAAIYFFEHGCERVELKSLTRHSGELAIAVFDAPELVEVATEEPVTLVAKKAGGPHDRKPAAGVRR